MRAKEKSGSKDDEKEDEETKQRFLRGVQEGDENKPTAEQQEYERGRQHYVKESLGLARRNRGRELGDHSRERAIENASKMCGRYHSSCEALGIMTDPKNVLQARQLHTRSYGSNSGVIEAAYGYRNGTHNGMDVIQAGVSLDL